MPMLLLAGLALALALTPAAAGSSRRVVIIEAEGPDNPAARMQVDALLGLAAELRERDMAVFARYGTASPVRLFGEGPAPRPERSEVRGQAPFLVRLIGKDGGEKLRSTTPVSPQELFGLIDSMPMRRQEMGR